ncbi:hotdog family protein [Oryzicola mucosus]|uniref:MaoC-like domain-containing protein n=1 Tax=Oryzicola mucosus TaxID=2767425 RepID=A0A8J6PN17_9HYPH|nr:MaoC/PaaZ C-terminal domain-containing protein [Oryzicola mucosus]MBD0417363.1 hypothetical protein [Oryzicola mucosus]
MATEAEKILSPKETGPILRHHLVEWCAAENDYYNIHYDDRAALEMGLASTPVQGTYKFALFGEMVRAWLKGRGRLLRISASYRKPDFEGASLRLGGEITGREDRVLTISLFLENGSGERTTTGQAVVRLNDDG